MLEDRGAVNRGFELGDLVGIVAARRPAVRSASCSLGQRLRARSRLRVGRDGGRVLLVMIGSSALAPGWAAPLPARSPRARSTGARLRAGSIPEACVAGGVGLRRCGPCPPAWRRGQAALVLARQAAEALPRRAGRAARRFAFAKRG